MRQIISQILLFAKSIGVISRKIVVIRTFVPERAEFRIEFGNFNARVC
jgi:hypothetical protein